MPNRTKFLAALDQAVDHFIDGNFTKYVVISHNDADGISSLHLVLNLLHRTGRRDYDYFIYNRSSSWSSYLSGILSKSQDRKTAYIFTDVGSNLTELIPIIIDRAESFFILDHHEVDVDIDDLDLPENLHFVNPTIYGYDGLDHIAGATLAYMFMRRVKPSLIKHGWLTLIGIAGDTLQSTNNLQSFNKEIYQELLDEEVFQEQEGLILFGGMHESIKNGLKNSILPFVKGLGGEDSQKIKHFLKKLRINPEKNVVDLDETEIEKIIDNTEGVTRGSYAILLEKQNLLKFTFEHALLLNILCFKKIEHAISIIQRKVITHYAQKLYYGYVSDLVNNLRILATHKIPQLETKKAIFIEVKGKIPPSNWSDTASFSMVNEIVNPNKILLLGGEMNNSMLKLSIRCSRTYLESNEGLGVNYVISRIKERLGGMGGGHKLAGGIRLSKVSYDKLTQTIDDLI